MVALRRVGVDVVSAGTEIGAADFAVAMRTLQPSIRADQLRQFEEYSASVS